MGWEESSRPDRAQFSGAWAACLVEKDLSGRRSWNEAEKALGVMERAMGGGREEAFPWSWKAGQSDTQGTASGACPGLSSVAVLAPTRLMKKTWGFLGGKGKDEHGESAGK